MKNSELQEKLERDYQMQIVMISKNDVKKVNKFLI